MTIGSCSPLPRERGPGPADERAIAEKPAGPQRQTCFLISDRSMQQQLQPPRAVGILGGMGPAAGADFVRLFVQACTAHLQQQGLDRKSTRLNSSHLVIS